MKKYLPLFLLFLGILNHLPLFINVDFLIYLYSNISSRLIVQTVIFIIFCYLIYKGKERKTIIFLGIFLTISLCNSLMNQLENKTIIFLNEGKSDVKLFSIPFLGYQALENTEDCIKCQGEMTIIYNIGFGSYDALVYQPNHNLKMNDIDKDASLIKIYNNNWWQFRYLD